MDINTAWLVATSVVTVASAVANITKTKKDDEIVGKVQKVMNKVSRAINILALNFRK